MSGLGTTLTALMHRRGVSSVAVGAACGVSRQMVQRWTQTGRVADVHIPALAKVLGTYPSVLAALNPSVHLSNVPRGCTEVEMETLRDMISSHATARAIVLRLGHSEAVIRRWMRAAGLNLTRGHRDGLNRSTWGRMQVTKLRAEGYGFHAIAEKTGYPVSSVHRFCGANGLARGKTPQTSA